MINNRLLSLILLGFLLTIPCDISAQTRLNTPNVNSILYAAKDKKQPLVVGFGGSEGGNAWASDYWKPTRDKFLEKGYAFLAVGYFGAPGTPDTLNRIALEDVRNAILEAAKLPEIDKNKIAVIGGSRGGDLALLMAGYYDDIRCVVAIVPSHVVFPGHTMHFSTSCWTYQNQDLPFVPLSEEAIPSLIKRDLRSAFEIMLKDTLAERKALIRVENIKGPVLLMSATKDEIIPSTDMCEKMMARLREHKFRYNFRHLAIEGSHGAPLKHFNDVFDFLEENFK